MSNPIKNLESGFGYEIYPRTFNDTDANGVGDIKGIIEKLPYLSFLGINKIWICPIFVSPGVDCGYDVEDYFNIGNDFGTIEDLEELIAKARQYNIGILLDLVPNHCSNKHTLFQKALSGLNSEERDMFIFRDPKEDGTPPNNWLSHFGGPA
ncbi:MAG: alpha-amylase family glycosyl hydrolase, partial [Acidimicrobiia bacterium]